MDDVGMPWGADGRGRLAGRATDRRRWRRCPEPPRCRGSSSASCSPAAARARSGRGWPRRRAAGGGQGGARRPRRGRGGRPRGAVSAQAASRARRAGGGVRRAAPTGGWPSSCRTCAAARSTASCGPAGTCRRGRSSPCWPRWPRRWGGCTTSASSTATSRPGNVLLDLDGPSGARRPRARPRPRRRLAGGVGHRRLRRARGAARRRPRARHPTSTRSGPLGWLCLSGSVPGAAGPAARAGRRCRLAGRGVRAAGALLGGRSRCRAETGPGAHELAWLLFGAAEPEPLRARAPVTTR